MGSEALRQWNESQEELEECIEEHDLLVRYSEAEMLRVMMLREAFDQEQIRVGESLHEAELCVRDLVTATEDTRNAESEEQHVAQECARALNYIRTAQAKQDLEANVKIAQLHTELVQSQVVESGVTAKHNATRAAALQQSVKMLRQRANSVRAVKFTNEYADGLRAEVLQAQSELLEVTRTSEAVTGGNNANQETLALQQHLFSALSTVLATERENSCYLQEEKLMLRLNNIVPIEFSPTPSPLLSGGMLVTKVGGGWGGRAFGADELNLRMGNAISSMPMQIQESSAAQRRPSPNPNSSPRALSGTTATIWDQAPARPLTTTGTLPAFASRRLLARPAEFDALLVRRSIA